MNEICLLIPSNDYRAPNKVVYSLSDKLNVEIVYVKQRSDYNHSHRLLKLTKGFLNNKYSVIHSHGFIPDLISFFYSFINKDIVLISTIHSNLELDLVDSKPLIGQFILKVWLKILGAFDIIVCMNNDAVKYFSDVGISKSKLKVIKNGININKFQSKIDNYTCDNSSTINVISWSLIREMKGHQYTINSMVYNERFVFKLIGDGDYLTDLKILSENYGVKYRCEFLGYRENFEEEALNSDVFVIMSDFEGSPLSLLEAILLGLPCVCRDIPAFRELFDESEVVFTKSTSEADLSEAIIQAYSNSESLTKNAYNKLVNNYTDLITSEKYLSIYKNYL